MTVRRSAPPLVWMAENAAEDDQCADEHAPDCWNSNSFHWRVSTSHAFAYLLPERRYLSIEEELIRGHPETKKQDARTDDSEASGDDEDVRRGRMHGPYISWCGRLVSPAGDVVGYLVGDAEARCPSACVDGIPSTNILIPRSAEPPPSAKREIQIASAVNSGTRLHEG